MNNTLQELQQKLIDNDLPFDVVYHLNDNNRVDKTFIIELDLDHDKFTHKDLNCYIEVDETRTDHFIVNAEVPDDLLVVIKSYAMSSLNERKPNFD